MRPGIKVPRYCKCGKYKPRSTKGIIITTCRNCGGERKPVVFGSRNF
jgi:hypothetical protein